MSGYRNKCTWVFPATKFVHKCQLDNGHLGDHSFQLSGDEVMDVSRRMAAGDEYEAATIRIASSILKRGAEQLLRDRDTDIAALRALNAEAMGLMERAEACMTHDDYMLGRKQDTVLDAIRALLQRTTSTPEGSQHE